MGKAGPKAAWLGLGFDAFWLWADSLFVCRDVAEGPGDSSVCTLRRGKALGSIEEPLRLASNDASPGTMRRQEVSLAKNYASPGLMTSQELSVTSCYALPAGMSGKVECVASTYAGVDEDQE